MVAVPGCAEPADTEGKVPGRRDESLLPRPSGRSSKGRSRPCRSRPTCFHPQQRALYEDSPTGNRGTARQPWKSVYDADELRPFQRFGVGAERLRY